VEPLPSAAIPRFFSPRRQQTVDGLHRVLEIARRSSYVPSSPNGVRSPVSGEAWRFNLRA
jgi:hypothetical protein